MFCTENLNLDVLAMGSSYTLFDQPSNPKERMSSLIFCVFITRSFWNSSAFLVFSTISRATSIILSQENSPVGSPKPLRLTG